MRFVLHAPVLVGLAAACTPAPPSIAWTIDFAVGAPRPPAVDAVRAWIRRGGCDGTETVYSAVLTPAGPMVAQPDHLEDGTWGFGADALDVDCRVVASACEEVVVPSTSSVTLLLGAVVPPSAGCAAPTVCVDGVCVGGLDAGGSDGGPVDAGSDAGADACPTTETSCADGGDDDCDTLIDCDDPDCTGQTCGAGARCGGGECCSTCVNTAGNCAAGTIWGACGTGGGPCVRCPDCVACMAGACSGSPAAGNPCASGTCIGTTTLTCCTGCVSGSFTTGTCETGLTDLVCGSTGDACMACPAGTICTERGDCCGGCTVSTGSCRSGTSSFQCGTGGVACVDCPAGFSCCDAPSGMGGMCVSGGCV